MLYVLLTWLFYPVLTALAMLRRKDVPERILVIQGAQIGDLVYSTGVFREIKKKYPQARLTALVKPITKSLLANNPYVDNIICVEDGKSKGFKKLARFSALLRKGRYDAVVALNPRVNYAVASLWALIPVRISLLPHFGNLSDVSDTSRTALHRRLPFMPRYYGINYALASRLHTHLVRHVAGNLLLKTYMKMLRPLGIDAEDITKNIYKSDDADKAVDGLFAGRAIEGRKLIGLAVTSGKKMKELGPAKVAAIADGITSRHEALVVFIGAAGDRQKADEALSLSRNRNRIIDSIGRFRLDQLPALLERLSLFIGVDSGITYMADALDLPIVSIAGPAEMEDQRPTGSNVIIIRKEFECSPCVHPFRAPFDCATGTRECIETVPVEDILNAAGRFL